MTAVVYQRSFFADTTGLPLDSGSLYIGVANQDPQTNPVQVYWDSALTIPATQPLTITAGYVTNSGVRAAYYVAADTYSLRARNKAGVQVDYIADANFNNFSGSSGSSQIGFLQTGTGAVTRTVQSRLRETVSVMDFGAVGDGVTNDLAAFQAATNYAMTQTDGCTVYIPRGRFKIVGSIIQDRSSITSRGVVNYIGSGRRSTTILHSGATTLFSATGPAAGVQQNTDLTIAGMTLLGTSATGEIAIGQSYCSDSHFADLHIEGFEYAFYLQDCDQAVFDACMIQFNKRGLFARQNPAPTGNSTQPNQLVFNGCTWMNNSQNGLQGIGVSNWTFNGGVISTNGTADNVNGFGIKLEESGYQGGNVATFTGTNFESNNGIADVILVQTTPTAPVVTQNTYVFTGCSFNRTDATVKAVNCILTNFAAASSVGEQLLTLVGCTFKSYNNYVPSSGTPYINWTGAQTRNARNFSAPGTVFKDPVEGLSFVQNITKPFAEISRASNQTIPNATPTVWQIDTIGPGFSWTTSINGSYQIPIPDDGVYSFGASVSFTTTPSGNSKIEVLRGTVGVAVNIMPGADVLTVGGTKYFSKGDLLSIRVTQSSGAAVTLAGSSTATSYFNLQKVMDA